MTPVELPEVVELTGGVVGEQLITTPLALVGEIHGEAVLNAKLGMAVTALEPDALAVHCRQPGSVQRTEGCSQDR